MLISTRKLAHRIRVNEKPADSDAGRLYTAMDRLMDSKFLTNTELEALSHAAAAAPRRRMNRNLHVELADPVQRLAIAMEPGTYVRPHRHVHTWEMLIVLTGELELVLFEADGATVSGREVLSRDHKAVFEMPAGTWHSVISRRPGTVVFEVKQGPYQPIAPDDMAAWAPAEGDAAVASFLRFLASARAGQRWPGGSAA